MGSKHVTLALGPQEEGFVGFLPRGGGELCAPGGGKGGSQNPKSHHKEPKKTFCVGKKMFRYLLFLKKTNILKAILWIFIQILEKNSRGKQGGSIKCLAGGGIRTLPFRKGVTVPFPPCPRMLPNPHPPPSFFLLPPSPESSIMPASWWKVSPPPQSREEKSCRGRRDRAFPNIRNAQ